MNNAVKSDTPRTDALERNLEDRGGLYKGEDERAYKMHAQDLERKNARLRALLTRYVEIEEAAAPYASSPLREQSRAALVQS